MRSGAILALIAWQLVQAEPIREIQRFDVDPNSISNVELLIPLMVQGSAVDERYDRAQLDDEDTPFSSIPDSAFIIDDDDVPPATPRSSRKRELAYRPRSLYLDSLESGERGELGEHSDRGADMWRTCTRLMHSQAEHTNHLLLLLCAELLDGVLPSPAPPAHGPQCDCYRQDGDPPWFGPVRARRDFMRIGDNSEMVLKYMNSPRRKKASWTQAQG